MPGTIVLAGGGTGGHLFPGLAIARTLQDRARALGTQPPACVFVASDRPLDTEILTNADADFRVLRARPFVRTPGGLAKFFASWGACVRESRALLRSLADDGPVAVAAMGGFVAAPVAQAARCERVPVLLVNLDAAPGLANRFIARRADDVVTSAAVMERARYARTWTEIPPIVRPGLLPDLSPEETRARLGLDPARPVLLATGGSQGAQSLSGLILERLRTHPQDFTGWQALHQTGGRLDDELTSAYAAADVPARVEKFVNDMGLWWRSASLAVTRGGAGTLAEMRAAGVPGLILPYPWHRDEHQKHNAEALRRASAALVEKDLIDPALNAPGPAGAALHRLLTDASLRSEMARASRSLGGSNGAQAAAERLISLLQPGVGRGDRA